MKIESWEFLKPIYIGDTVHAETEVIDKKLNGRRTGYVTWRRRLVNQAGDVVQSGIFQTLVSVVQVHRSRQDRATTPTSATSHVSVKRAAG